MYDKPVLVRPGYTEQDVWRAALGNYEPLRAFATLSGDLDAPLVLPAGSTRATQLCGPLQTVFFRN